MAHCRCALRITSGTALTFGYCCQDEERLSRYCIKEQEPDPEAVQHPVIFGTCDSAHYTFVITGYWEVS
jgi:hypothetical protein